jgi:hypothetical protein
MSDPLYEKILKETDVFDREADAKLEAQLARELSNMKTGKRRGAAKDRRPSAAWVESHGEMQKRSVRSRRSRPRWRGYKL